MKIYFCGQLEFGNHGCEALIRSTVKLLREQTEDELTFLVPSVNETSDATMWPQAQRAGVRFVSSPPIGTAVKWWGRLDRRMPFSLVGLGLPKVPLRQVAEIKLADAVVVTGGDILSLEYGTTSLVHWMGLAELAMSLGKPVHVVAASIGPFASRPDLERRVAQFLKRCTSISVRESSTFKYLSSLGVYTRLVADPAFSLDAEPTEFDRPDGPLVGINVSPLIRKFRTNEGHRVQLDRDVGRFISGLIGRGLGVLLVPHVEPSDGASENNDRRYLQSLLANLDGGNAVALLRPSLNAAQLKYAIGCCDWFIGARTHATIASLSQGVPTLSIAYSVKAVGINSDIFGDDRYVLRTSDVSSDTLDSAFGQLQSDGPGIKQLLKEKLPRLLEQSRDSVSTILPTPR